MGGTVQPGWICTWATVTQSYNDDISMKLQCRSDYTHANEYDSSSGVEKPEIKGRIIGSEAWEQKMGYDVWRFLITFWASDCLRVRLNVCTSCWEKTGGLLFSSCTVTTTVQELFRPAKHIIVTSVSDLRSAHHENNVCCRNKRPLFFFTPRSMQFIWKPEGVNIATSSPLCSSNKAADALANGTNMSCPFLAH